MKISRLLNNIYIFIYLFFNFITIHLYANEPIDIWNIKKENNKEQDTKIQEEIDDNQDSSVFNNKIKINNQEDIIKDENLKLNDVNLYGLYDPIQNNLSIDMWSKSDGNEIKSIFERIKNLNLSEDSSKILNIALLTNSYFPSKNISNEEFLEFKLNYLIKNKNLDLIKLFLDKNRNLKKNYTLIKFYVDKFLVESDIENACDIFNFVDLVENDYLIKFQIYCLVNHNKRDEAQIIFDLKKEIGFTDLFFENKFNILMGYSTDNVEEILEDNILNFHLSHRTNPDFSYAPNINTSPLIWRYLSKSNLLENVNFVDIEDEEKIKIIEKATSEKNYTEEELFDLYKRFQFNINQLLTAKDTYKLLPTFKGRALIYQRLLLTNDPKETLIFSYMLKNSFTNDKISNAFNLELSKILEKIKIEDVPPDYLSFYEKNLITKKLKKNSIKLNNKILHQSKLLNYFLEKEDLTKVEKQTNDLLKKIKKNKDYYFSKEDMMLLESLKSDGLVISNKYKKIYDPEEARIPPDIQLLIKNKETGLILLRLVEIIGEDDLVKLDTDSIYFIIDILNKLDMDNLRNDFLLKVLPLKV